VPSDSDGAVRDAAATGEKRPGLEEGVLAEVLGIIEKSIVA
jgi:hypothetical protein